MTSSSDQADQRAVQIVGLALAIGFGGLLAVLLNWNASQFDGSKIIGCYSAVGTPIVRVHKDTLTSSQSGFSARSIQLAEDNQSYGFKVRPGLGIQKTPIGYRLVDVNERSWVPIETRKRGGTMTLYASDYTSIELPKVPCPQL